MKIRFFLTAAAAITAAAFLIGAGIYIHSLKDDITVNTEVIYGDEKAARGSDIRIQSRYSSNDRLTWDIRFQAGHENEADVRFKKVGKNLYSDSFETCARLDSEFTIFAGEPRLAEAEEKMLDAALKQKGSREITTGEDTVITLKMRDYLKELPLQLDIFTEGFSVITKTDDIFYSDARGECAAAEKALRDYFRIPVTDDMLLDIVLTKSSPDEEISPRADTEFSVPLLCAADKSGVFLAFNRLHCAPYEPGPEITDVPEYNNAAIPLPEGSVAAGIHYIPLKALTGEDDVLIPDTKNIRLFYPLSEDAVLLQLSESTDEKSLLLLTAEDDRLFLSVIDKSKGSLRQKILLKEAKGKPFIPNEQDSYMMDRGSHILITEQESVYLLEKSDGKYNPVLSGSYSGKLNYSAHGAPCFDFDGEKLAVIMPYGENGWNESYSACEILIFTKKSLRFSGTCRINIDESYPGVPGGGPPAEITLPGSVIKDEAGERRNTVWKD